MWRLQACGYMAITIAAVGTSVLGLLGWLPASAFNLQLLTALACLSSILSVILQQVRDDQRLG